jgi:ribosomal protein S27E
MRTNKKKCDNATIEWATYMSKNRMASTIDRAEKFKQDPEVEKRHEEQECQVCFYEKGRVGGAAMTEIECALCNKTTVFPSTNTDILCPECAKEHNLCKHCGGDIDSKKRRKQRF